MSEQLEQTQEAINHYIPTLLGWSTTEKCYEMARLIEDNKVQTSVELGIFAGRGFIINACPEAVVGFVVLSLETGGRFPWIESPDCAACVLVREGHGYKSSASEYA